MKDLNGNLLPNQAVTLKLTSTNNAFALDTTTGVVTTGTNGTASFNVFSYGQAGTATVQASLTGVSTPPTQNVTFTAQPNPQLVGSLTSSVSAGSPTPFTMIFRNSNWQPVPANTQVWAQVTNPSATPPYSLANTGGLSVTGSTTAPVQTLPLTTDSQGQVYVTYTAATILANNITVTFYQDAACQNKYSGQQLIQFNVALLGPTTVTATPKSATEIDLSWTAVANATSYVVQRSTDNVTWTQVGPILAAPSSPAYNDLSVSPGTTYYYQVGANTPNGATQFVASGSVLTFPAAPTVTATAISGVEIDLSWNSVTSATGYNVFYEVVNSTGGYTQYNTTTLPMSPNATYPTCQVTGLTPSTNYSFYVTAINGSGATGSTFVTQTTTANVPAPAPVTSFTVTTPAPQIYYSAVQTDAITNNTIPLTTPVTIKGTGNNPAGVAVAIKTDRGSFVVNGPGQTLSADQKTLSGTLDATGTIIVLFQGRPPTTGSGTPAVKGRAAPRRGAGTISLPALTELGTPLMTATLTGNNSTTLSLNGAGNTLPLLIGPPNKIALALTAPNNATNTAFSANVNAPWCYSNQNLTATATVTDLNGQAVLPGMPIWFGQSWTSCNVNSAPSNAYYQSAEGAGNVSTVSYITDINGTVSNVNLGSNHSGAYTLQCFALSPSSTPAALATIPLNLPNPVPYSATYAQQNFLATDNTLSSPVTAAQVFWVDTYVAYNGWGQPTVSVGGSTPTTTPQGINSDGTQWATIAITGKDPDGKWVLPGTPFSVSGSITMSTTQYGVGIALPG